MPKLESIVAACVFLAGCVRAIRPKSAVPDVLVPPLSDFQESNAASLPREGPREDPRPVAHLDVDEQRGLSARSRTIS